MLRTGLVRLTLFASLLSVAAFGGGWKWDTLAH
jgi:hypothetical protein